MTALGSEIPQPQARERPVGMELELKFLASEADFKAIQQSPLLGVQRGKGLPRRMLSTYFDTEDADLRHQRMALRVRRLRGGSVQTLKWNDPGGDSPFQRGEIEVPTPSAEPDLALFGEEVAAKLTRVTGGRPLRACFTTDIKRATRRVTVGTSEIEAAFDFGAIVSGQHKLAVREVELELKAGEPADLYQFGLTLATAFPIRLGVLSKAERGVMLESGQQAEAVRAINPDIARQTVDQAIGTIIGACIGQFMSNWPVFENGRQEDAVHQMRVSMRRLRSALVFFQRRFPCQEFVTLRAEAKRIASAMGDARNWDVFLGLLRDGASVAFPSERGFETVLAEASERQQVGYAQVAALLHDPATSRFVLSAQEFVARRGWRNAVSSSDLSHLTEPVSGFAAEVLQRLHRRVRKRGRNLLDLASPDRHEVRIALKNLRYASDFFGHIFDRVSQVRGFTRACADLQDVLGSYNDTIMIADLVRQLDLSEAAPARATGIILGWYGHGAVMQDAHLQETWKAFRKAKAFWADALPAEPREA